MSTRTQLTILEGKGMERLTKEEAKQKIMELIEDYRKQYPQGPPRNFNEENTKQWIDELFRRLGWNLLTDMSKEEKSGRRKRVDYAFKIDGTVQFLLEAKKPSENLDDHVKQAVEYGYQNSKRWVVLTNFEEVRIYNAEYWDKAEEIKRLFVPLRIDEFIKRFDDLWLLSKPAFADRLIEKIAKQYGKMKPKEPITKLLAEDMYRWRRLLTKGIGAHKRLNNIPSDPQEAKDYIDEMVQRILDRILFIRVAEDRGNEEPVLDQALKDWRADKSKKLSEYLRLLFRKMDDVYNSGIFREHESEKLTIDNEIYEQIIKETDESPTGLKYDFDAIDADILGSVYEQYLSVLLKKTAKRATLKKSKGRRKEQGIYYTPTYIVEYIVKNTLGEMLKGKKPEEVAKIKVLDPACGSGSFLIKAFDEIKEYYKKEKGQQKLNTESKILTDNIYGVDLDPKAVEIARLNLLLKAAETKHKLPELDRNIKCGNSLIDSTLSEEKRAFNWNEEFEEIMKNGGFDVVIGNPPYIRNRELNPKEKKIFETDYQSATGQYDIYQLFFEKSIDLLKEGGMLGFITSNKYTIASYGERIRKLILNKCQIISIIDVSNIRVFKDAAIYPYIILLRKNKFKNIRDATKIQIFRAKSEEDLLNLERSELKQSEFLENEGAVFKITFNKEESSILTKLDHDCVKLGEIVTIKETIHTGNIRRKLILDSREGTSSKKLLRGKDCKRYYYKWKGLWVNVNKDSINRAKGEYATIPSSEYFEQPKLFLREIADRITVCYDERDFYSLNKAYVVILKDRKYSLKYLMGLLNSKLLSWYFRAKFESAHVRGGHLQYKKQYTTQIPIKDISQNKQKEIEKLVENIITLYSKTTEIGNKQTDEKTRIAKKILETEKNIDELVYRIYGLTEEEKKIVEASFN
ncbi:hypothetical protein DRN67_00160 [Candidatus Micrarchaeota archaeon]|nr:MAG: hypothetical protein DRN67_00160 [Candidatus Micrarchaeota archaeon]